MALRLKDERKAGGFAVGDSLGSSSRCQAASHTQAPEGRGEQGHEAGVEAQR